MELDLSSFHDDPLIKDFLRQVGSIFGVGLEMESDGHGVVYRNFSDEETGKWPVSSASIHMGTKTDARLNIYHMDADQKKIATIEALVRDKLEDYVAAQSLTHELLASYDKLNLYRSLAEQILQPKNVSESYGIILQGLESVIRAGKCGIFSVQRPEWVGELVACRHNGQSIPPHGMKFEIMGTLLERVVAEKHSHLFMESVCETIRAIGGKGKDIQIKGPFLVAPLLYRKGEEEPVLVGFLFAHEPLAGDFTSVDQHAISIISSLASIAMKHFEALETARAATFEMDTMLNDLMSTFDTLQQQVALVEQVNRISVRINSTLDLDMIFNSIADYSRSLLNSEGAVVAVRSGQGKVSLAGAAGMRRDQLPRAVTVEQGSILDGIFNSPKPVIENHCDPAKFIMGFTLPISVFNFTTYPIESKGKIVAVIIVFNKKGKETFSGTDSDFLKALAYQATTAIENARLLNNLKQTQFTMMAKLSELAEKRDPETGEHLLRMQKYSRIIAQEMSKNQKFAKSVDENFINEIYVASPLHDIGKVAIADIVLLKRGKLTGEEFEIMKTHAFVGGMILQGPDYLKMASEIATHHHEKYDGTGYPHGLKGDAIPLSARIVAVSDVYDALTSRRVYKEAMSHEVALDIIDKGISTHFDPDVVAAMKTGIGEILTIKNLIR